MSLQSSDDEEMTPAVSKIDEEYVDQLGSMHMSERKRTSKLSNPIHISHHTVSGHEALNLAKRLSEELATQSHTQSNLTRAISPEVEPISRSYEAKKGISNNAFMNLSQIYLTVFHTCSKMTTYARSCMQ